MKVSSFFKNLEIVSEDRQVIFKTPDGKFIPFHFHVTEAATVNKKFRDCGGVERNETYASIQLWAANDFEHRINAGKIRKIMLNTLLENENDIRVRESMKKLRFRFLVKNFLRQPVPQAPDRVET
jgi:hypothetical protein